MNSNKPNFHQSSLCLVRAEDRGNAKGWWQWKHPDPGTGQGLSEQGKLHTSRDVFQIANMGWIPKGNSAIKPDWDERDRGQLKGA